MNSPTPPEVLSPEKSLACLISSTDQNADYAYYPTEEAPPPKGYYRVVKPIRYTRLPACGHRFDPNREPRFNNCESCWFAFFQTHGELTQTADELFQKHGIDAIRQIRGKKFAENWLKFMATLAQWKQQMEGSTNVHDKS